MTHGRASNDKVVFHSLFVEPEKRRIVSSSSESYEGIHPNAIAAAFSNLYDREVSRSIGKSK